MIDSFNENINRAREDMVFSIMHLKCNKDQTMIKSQVQACQQFLMLLKPHLTFFYYGSHLDNAKKAWKSSYEFNQLALAKLGRDPEITQEYVDNLLTETK